MEQDNAADSFSLHGKRPTEEVQTKPLTRRLPLRRIAITIGLLVTAWFVVPRFRYELVMWRVHARIDRGDMGWTDDVEDWLAYLDKVTLDKVWLADRLLAESDGSLACEGMILAYKTRHPQLRRILEEHLGDQRWNWSLSSNNDIARQLLNHLDGRDEHVQPFVLEDWIANWPN